METIVYLVLFSALVGTVSAVNCTNMADGNYEKGCRSYAVCNSGSVSIVDCDPKMVYNNVTGGCDDRINVLAPCGDLKDCTGKADGLFADVDQNCNSFYTCYREKFLGHNFCSANLVFDEKLNTCNYIDAVLPPCGTLVLG